MFYYFIKHVDKFIFTYIWLFVLVVLLGSQQHTFDFITLFRILSFVSII